MKSNKSVFELAGPESVEPMSRQEVRSMVFGAVVGVALALVLAGVMSATASAQALSQKSPVEKSVATSVEKSVAASVQNSVAASVQKSVVASVLKNVATSVAQTVEKNVATSAAQSAEKMDHAAMQASAAKAPVTEAQKAFAILKSFAGEWQGGVTMNPPMNGVGKADVDVSLRVTSRGNSIVHEMQASNTPFDYTKQDHPVTMFYVDGDQLNLVHYCDAGNRPHMVARPSADGKTVEFDFVDVSGPTKFGNMYHAVFTKIDENHHIEEWTFKTPAGMMKARSELARKSSGGSTAGK